MAANLSAEFMIEPATCAAATGAAIVGCGLGVMFGPHIGYAELAAAIVGAGFYIAKAHMKNRKTEREDAIVIIGLSFIATFMCSLWVTEAVHGLVTQNTDFKLATYALPGLTALVAFLLQPLGNRLWQAAGEVRFTNKFPFITFKADR